MRIVIDTNVCLDLFIFHDPRCAALLEALKNGTVLAVTSANCRNEWLRVLDYPNLLLDAESKLSCTAAFDAFITCLTPPPSTAPLPLCSDSDDQKFLEIARDSNASALITKDKALLKLARKTKRAGLFSICKPEAWQPQEK